MPELPEVETVVRALSGVLPGRRLTCIETFRDAIRLPLASLSDPDLLRRKIIAVRRRARYPIIELTGKRALLLHLGMTGTIRVVPATEPRRKHEHVILHLDDGNTCRFDDPRRFGFVIACRLTAPGADPDELADLGPEPLSDAFTAEYLHTRLCGVKQKIKTALMDNAIVVGIGNIYANESLFRAGISPLRVAEKVTLPQCRKLVGQVKQTLQAAIRAGGTSISDFHGVDGAEGKFVRELQIYGKAGQPCPRCQSPIRRLVLGGRGTFYCSRCQR